MTELLIISGLSGSGKSIALHTLEDLGYYCIDNLPLILLQAFIEQMPLIPHFHKTAIALDIRNLAQNTHDLDGFTTIIQNIRRQHIDCKVFFLQASAETLIKRFRDTRRRHPLLSESHLALTDALAAERKLLAPVYDASDWVIDTSTMHLHELRHLISRRVSEPPDAFSILLESFGFKQGVPQDADYMFDVRCLPNPYWEPHLRQATGLDASIRDYLDGQPPVNQLFNAICSCLEICISCICTSQRRYLTIAIGCTGGQHRSVYFVERLAAQWKTRYQVMTRHRELLHTQRLQTDALSDGSHC